MPFDRGSIVLMGSGELTGTMVELHKLLLRPYGASAKALFMDTPAGFQLNVDHIWKRAREYFEQRVQKPLKLASFKSAGTASDLDAAQTFTAMAEADYVLIGPGSPTYALQQWRQSAVPKLLTQLIERGGCLVAASAAALTMGRLTLPVYEIYKVGQSLHWVDGLDILGYFGLNAVVFPHWNNAEGGNHDTRFCFMGEQRFQALEKLMPANVQILGLDEHTALIIDFARSHGTVYGVGQVTLRRSGREWAFKKGDIVPFSLLMGQEPPAQSPPVATAESAVNTAEQPAPGDDIWERLHRLADDLRQALDHGPDDQAGALLLEMERRIWQARDLLEEQDGLGAARELFREMVAIFSIHLTSRSADPDQRLAALVESLIKLRTRFRNQKKWDEADAIRQCLQTADIRVEDTPRGTRWIAGGS